MRGWGIGMWGFWRDEVVRAVSLGGTRRAMSVQMSRMSLEVGVGLGLE